MTGVSAVPNDSALEDHSAVPDHSGLVDVSAAPDDSAALDDLAMADVSAVAGVSARTFPPDWSDLNRAMALDKKRVAGTDRFVLLEALAQPAIHTNIPPTAVQEACRRLGLCEERE